MIQRTAHHQKIQQVKQHQQSPPSYKQTQNPLENTNVIVTTLTQHPPHPPTSLVVHLDLHSIVQIQNIRHQEYVLRLVLAMRLLESSVARVQQWLERRSACHLQQPSHLQRVIQLELPIILLIGSKSKHVSLLSPAFLIVIELQQFRQSLSSRKLLPIVSKVELAELERRHFADEQTLDLIDFPLERQHQFQRFRLHLDQQSDCCLRSATMSQRACASHTCIQQLYLPNCMQSEREQNDLNVPLNSKNKFLHFIFRNKEINKVAYKQVIVCFASATLLLLSLSIYYFVAVASVQTLTQLYYQPGTSTCLANTPCTVNFTIKQDLQPPIYLLYQLEDFYQNHRRYIQSKSNFQLSGHTIQQSDAKVCSPYVTNSDLKVTKSWAGVDLDPNAIASPCGGIAYTVFNDTFQLQSRTGTPIPITDSGITWPGDKGGKYRRASNSNSTQWIDPQNEHFIVWMRTAGLPQFKKLWGIIQQALPAAEYQMTVSNAFNLTEWHGKKYFILTTNSGAGGKNFLLPIIFLFSSLGSAAAVGVLLVRVRYYRKLLSEQ